MCCLKYEQNVYEDLLKNCPKNGSFVKTPDGNGNVIDFNLLSGKFTVKLKDNPDAPPRVYDRKDLTMLKENRSRPRKNEGENKKELADK